MAGVKVRFVAHKSNGTPNVKNLYRGVKFLYIDMPTS